MQITSLRLFKVLFGIYFAIAWLSILPFSEMSFVRLNNISSNPSLWWSWLATHNLTNLGVISLILSSLGLMFDKTTRVSSIWLLINWITLYQFMPFMFFPPNGTYIGWILLWLSFFPNILSSEHKQGWWLVLCAGYFVSGLAKINSDVWQQGLAVEFLFNSPVGKDNALFFNNYPLLAKFLTYATLLLEIGAIFICFNKYGKRVLWFCFLLMHLSITIFLHIPEIGLFFLIFNIALIEDDSLSLK